MESEIIKEINSRGFELRDLKVHLALKLSATHGIDTFNARAVIDTVSEAVGYMYTSGRAGVMRDCVWYYCNMDRSPVVQIKFRYRGIGFKLSRTFSHMSCSAEDVKTMISDYYHFDIDINCINRAKSKHQFASINF